MTTLRGDQRLNSVIVKTLNDIAVEPVFTCPLCNDRKRNTIYKGLKDLLFGAPGEWTLNQCSGCGLVFLDPRPVIKDIGKTYTTSYSNRKTVRPSKGLTWYKKLRKRFRSEIRLGFLANVYGYKMSASLWQRIIAFPVSVVSHFSEQYAYNVMKLPFTPGGRLLDIGCGIGNFICLMVNLGWKAEGLDTDPEVLQICRNRGLTVREGTLENQRYPDNYFDAVTMKHVIEHVYDPVSLLRECHRILRPGGRLVILTPNLESQGHKEFKQLWIGLDPPRHLFLFTSKTLSEAIQREEFKVVDLSSTGRISEFNWLGSYNLKKYKKNVYFDNPNLFSRVMAKIYDKKIHLRILWDKMAGEELMLVATKRHD